MNARAVPFPERGEHQFSRGSWRFITPSIPAPRRERPLGAFQPRPSFALNLTRAMKHRIAAEVRSRAPRWEQTRPAERARAAR